MTLYVSAGGTGDCTTQVNACGSIQTAINAAEAGTYNGDDVTIDVAAGTYTENDSVSASSLNSLTIAGAGAISTIVNGGGVQTVFTVSDGTVTISGLTITNGLANQPGAFGPGTASGGILNTAALTVTDSTLSDNSGIDGGGIQNYAGATMNVTDSTLSGNSGAGAGGGIFNAGSTMNITDSTLSGNSGGCSGGGIWNTAASQYGAGSTMKITDSTLSGNSAGCTGGGIGTYNSSTSIGATIIAGNGGSNCGDAAGSPVTSVGYNLTDNGTCGFTSATDVTVAPAAVGLGALGNNGGPTQTILPAAGSPAIGVIPNPTTLNGVNVCPRTDQRGVASVPGANCTIGAVEVAATATVHVTATPSPATLGNVTYHVTVSGAGATPTGSVSVSDEYRSCSIATLNGSGAGSCRFGEPAGTH
ncbi:MAG TPA: choice-of-anchor Q domain-containing protein, partial [Acidimicrobiales bacterium]|nr:choice-of-anchor Q domain-containing protein [Acidimicrobiales bacterium]